MTTSDPSHRYTPKQILQKIDVSDEREQRIRVRVAFLSPCWPHDLFPNGIASYVSSIRSGLDTLGVETRVLASVLDEGHKDPQVSQLSEDENQKSLGVRLKQRISSSLSRPLGVQQILGYRVGTAAARMDEHSSLDLIEVEETFGIGAVAQRYFKKPVVVRLHGPWCVIGPTQGHRKGLEFWLRCAVEYLAIRNAKGVSSPSRDALDQVRRFYRLPLPNARVIPNPVPTVSDEHLWNSQSADPNTILFVGRFDRVKGADTLLQAFARVASKRPDLRLIFIGPDTGIIQGSRSVTFQDYLDENIPRAVHGQILFKGILAKPQIADHRRSAALTVVSSRYETFSMTVVEAMAAGSPLIASRAGGIKEIVSDGRTGLLFDAEDSDGLADQIERLLADRELAAQLGTAARAQVIAHYSETAVAQQTRAFYEEIVKIG